MEIRNMLESDVPDIADIVLTTWEMETYGREIARPSSEVYVLEHLYSRSFAKVAIVDGKAVGCIIGDAGTNRTGKIRGRERLSPRMEAISGMDGYKEYVSDMDIMHRGQETMLHDSGLSYDGEISLFIVSETMRGRGIGKALYMEALEIFRDNGCESIVIFTDNDCGYSFYDNMGCSRVADTKVELDKELLHMMTYNLRLSYDNV